MGNGLFKWAACLAAAFSMGTLQGASQGLSSRDFAAEWRSAVMDNASEYKRGEFSTKAWERSGADQKVSMVGREDLIANIPRSEGEPPTYTCLSNSDKSAIEQIAELAKAHSLVIINEDHAKPRHRLFIRNLAVRLRSEGFTHYAAETFAPSINDGTGFPRVGDGYYTTEPMMVRLVHHIRSLGFELVPYEMRFEQFPPEGTDPKIQRAMREEAQAQNIMDSVLTDSPNTKMIMHVGHGHVFEVTPQGDSWAPMMAARIKQKSGLDPLTIELTSCRSNSGEVVLSDLALTSGGIPVARNTDYLVGLPPLEFTQGRPNYRSDAGDIRFSVPESLKPKMEPVLIEARPPGAEVDQEPIERLYLEPGEDIPLMLPPGDWSLISINKDQRISEPVIVSVGDG